MIDFNNVSVRLSQYRRILRVKLWKQERGFETKHTGSWTTHALLLAIDLKLDTLDRREKCDAKNAYQKNDWVWHLNTHIDGVGYPAPQVFWK